MTYTKNYYAPEAVFVLKTWIYGADYFLYIAVSLYPLIAMAKN